MQFTGQQFVDFADLLGRAGNSVVGVVIAITTEDTLTLSGVLASQLRADDFLFA